MTKNYLAPNVSSTGMERLWLNFRVPGPIALLTEGGSSCNSLSRPLRVSLLTSLKHTWDQAHTRRFGAFEKILGMLGIDSAIPTYVKFTEAGPGTESYARGGSLRKCSGETSRRYMETEGGGGWGELRQGEVSAEPQLSPWGTQKR